MKILKISTLSGYSDRDELMMHAMFQIFVDFMEREEPGKHTDYTWCRLVREQWREMQRLYKWWTIERPARKEPKALHKAKNCRKIESFYDKWNAEDDSNLRSLLGLRRTLWT